MFIMLCGITALAKQLESTLFKNSLHQLEEDIYFKEDDVA